MKTLVKLALGVAMMAGAAVGAAVPAQAGVAIGIGIGGPGPGPYWHHGWCYYHPYRCGHYGGPGVYPEGYFVVGRGYWWHGAWWGHRGWGRHGWHYWH